MRLYDRVINDDILRREPSIDAAVVVDVSNVSAYLSGHEFDPHSVPSYMPPFNTMWLETSRQYLFPGWDLIDNRYSQIGTLFHCIECDYTSDRNGDHIVCEVFYKSFVLKNGRPIVHPEHDDGVCVIPLNASGQWVHHHSESDSGFWHDAIHLQSVRDIAPQLMAIGFMHCKNVEVLEGEQPSLPIRKKQEKKLGRPLTSFKLLKIDPSLSRSALNNREGEIVNEHSRSLHICRGHFATYSEDKPLFGKYSGTFWKPAHVRGNADNGTVYKDYKVKAPK